MKKKNRLIYIIVILLLAFFIGDYFKNDSFSIKQEDKVIEKNDDNETIENNLIITLDSIPEYSGKPSVAINNNKPFFNPEDLVASSYEKYLPLDSLGRATGAISSVGKDLMPTEERQSLSSVKPTGWHLVKYNGIDGNYLYNRCHLIGFQLTGENANPNNLITCTRYMNVTGMLEYENAIADYVNKTNNHVLYRVTPIYDGDNLLASGALMEAQSVEDNGAGLRFNIYVYNVQPGITIDYATGDSNGPEFTGGGNTAQTNIHADDQTSTTQSIEQDYVANTNTHKFHKPECSSVSKTSEKNKWHYHGTRESLIAQGYDPCAICNP
jgi:DNA-entry nuclease